jgi:hypothetical protein
VPATRAEAVTPRDASTDDDVCTEANTLILKESYNNHQEACLAAGAAVWQRDGACSPAVAATH